MFCQMVSQQGVNGAIRHCYELTTALGNSGESILLVHKPGAWISSQAFPPRVQLLESSFQRRPRELKRVAGELRRCGVSLVHTHLSSANLFGVLLARLFRFRSVATCHMPHLQPHWWWNDRIICPSKATAGFQNRVNLVPRSRIDVIPYPLNCRSFQPRHTAATVRTELQIPADRFLICVVGDVSARKAPHILLEALPKLIAAGVRPHAVFAGRLVSDYEKRFRATLSDLQLQPFVSVLGLREDVPDLVNAADCVCLPSTREVTPMALLEAMSLGTPVVSTKVGGVAECIRDGVDGWVVDANEPDQLADRLMNLGLDFALRRRMGENAVRYIQERFSTDVVLPQILNCYDKTCGQRQAARAA